MKQILFAVILTTLLAGCGPSNYMSVVDTQLGKNGQDGYSSVSSSKNNPALCGAAGGVEVFFALDMNRNLLFDAADSVQTQYVLCNGSKGDRGEVGATGLTGQSCTASKVGTVSTIKCGTSQVVVNDGATGATGAAGTNASGIYITAIINPCGVNWSNDEVLLKLSNGRLLGLYDGGPNDDRLSLIIPGTYRTTDTVSGKYCTFTVTNDYNITNEQLRNNRGELCD